MISKGEFKFDNATYGVILSHTKSSTEAVLVNAGTVVSAYKTDITGNYSYANVRAKELVSKLKVGLRQCTSKNGVPTPCELGSMNTHNFTKSKVQYSIMLYRGEVYGAYITSDTFEINLEYTTQFTIPKNIPYIKLTDIETENKEADNDLDSVPVRTVEEIALEKDDVSWLKNKKYYVVNDDETAEKLFTFFDNYNGIIAYDTETTGLKINCFGKINSKYQKDLIKYNEEHPNDKIRADKLVGLIFCVEPNVSYYFAAGHRKFKNLYDDRNSETRKKVVANIKAKYTVGELKDEQGDMARYIRETPDTEWSSDIILMERCRHILETKALVAHNGTYEYKVGLQYDIDTNIKEDTIIMHQLMYKFRSTTSNRGEPSNLKYLAKVELGVDQWELKDFFPNLKEDKKGTVKGKGNKSRIDFSYMDYAGTQVYAPTDGDVTLQLYYKYKKDMLDNHKEMEYIYSVEMIVSLAMGYMEFYGHRLDETKLDSTRARTEADIAVIESKIRQMINYSSAVELNEYSLLTGAMNKLEELEKSEENGSAPANVKELIVNCNNEIQTHTSSLNNAMHNDTEHPLNLGSPAQVAELFYDKIGCPIVSADGKKTVNKAAQKALLKEKNDDGTLKFPVVQLYADYKKQVTLLQKFFGVLQDYMYPGGFIFSSFGQISTATGRMSCSKPNAQQYPKAITKIVIPREGCVMVDADYSQIEYRVLTALAGNTELAKLFSNPDSDYHTLMASLMYGVDYSSVTGSMRSAAKSFNFGIPYGMGMGSLAILLTGKNTQQTRDEAAEKYEMYFKNQPRTRKFFADIKEMAQVNGYTKTLFNRYRYYSFTEPDGTINNAKKAAALRQAGNAVIQGTAADIFKISVARNFSYIRRNKLFGKFFIVNMIHDEQLMEVDVQHLNLMRIIADIGHNMQFKLDGFPPLYIGAGVGKAWGYAKGKQAEIHPLLLEQYQREAEGVPIFREDCSTPVDTHKVLDYFADRVIEFRRQKVINYLIDSANWGNNIHPAIAGLINLQFNYGRGDDAKSYVGPNGEKYSDHEFLFLNLQDFITENKLDVKTEYFTAEQTSNSDEEEDKEYNDGEETGEDIDLSEFEEDMKFRLIDESDKVYGSNINDIIAQFGICVINHAHICGIDVRNIYFKNLDNIINYLMKHQCDESDPDALQVAYLKPGNILQKLPVFVKEINSESLENIYEQNE